ncbi:ABC transporter permease [Longispora albida]|uniref:ABC transporter permease n=1 Tax=Longispora albida TaxID=203523 RepID=UPI00037507A9|nr:ABC transporter permease [Longispora albida]
MSALRTTLRMSWRQVRRAKGRSALVIVMLMLPVLAVSFGASMYDTFKLSPAEVVTRTMGQAQAVVSWPHDGEIRQAPDGEQYFPVEHRKPAKQASKADLQAKLPAGAVLSLDRRGGAVLKLPSGGSAEVSTRSIDYVQPAAKGILTQVSGRAPGPGEVVLSAKAAERFKVKAGDRIHLFSGTASYLVTGIVEQPGRLRDQFVVALPGTLPDSDPAQASSSDRWLVTLAASPSWQEILKLNETGVLVASRSVVLDPPPDDQVPLYAQMGNGPGGFPVDKRTAAYMAMIVALAMLEVVLLAGPAFAVGARRRQRELALVGAAGGTPAQIRRIVLADGIVLGILAAGVGIVLGLALALVTIGPAEELAGRRAGAFRVLPWGQIAAALLAITTGLAGAMVPAFTAARVNLVAALSGRRGITRSRKLWIWTGIAMTGAGALAIVAAILTDNVRPMMVGLVLVELGVVLCTPAVVGGVAKLGRFLPLTPRIALRDAARNRASAAPAIAAVLAAVAGSVAVAGWLTSDMARQEATYWPTAPIGSVRVDMYTPESRQMSTHIASALRVKLPATGTVEYQRLTCGKDQAGKDKKACHPSIELPKEKMCFAWALERGPDAEEIKRARKDPLCNRKERTYSGNILGFVVDDGSKLGALTGMSGPDLDRAKAALAGGKVLVTDDRTIADGKANLKTTTYPDYGPGGKYPAGPGPESEAPKPVETSKLVPAELFAPQVAGLEAVVSPATAQAYGLGAELAGFAVQTSRMPSESEMDALNGDLSLLDSSLHAQLETGAPYQVDDTTIGLMILLAAASLVMLGAAWIATGLAAADGRADLSTLAAVGATPGFRRRLSLWQSGVIAGLGGILGSIVGLAMLYAVLTASNSFDAKQWPIPEPFPLTPPWLLLAMVLLGVPLLAMLGAGLLTRSRLPIERRVT